MPRAPISEPRLIAWQTSAIDVGACRSSRAHRLEGERHVGAGVAVGHRVDVEPVQLFLVRAERVAEAQHALGADPRRARLVSVGIGAPGSYGGRLLASLVLSDDSTVPTVREVLRTMSSVCDVCGKKPIFGMKLSHSHRRTKRRWNPNIQRVRAIVNGSPKRVNVCTSCLKAGKVVKA